MRNAIKDEDDLLTNLGTPFFTIPKNQEYVTGTISYKKMCRYSEASY